MYVEHEVGHCVEDLRKLRMERCSKGCGWWGWERETRIWSISGKFSLKRKQWRDLFKQSQRGKKEDYESKIVQPDKVLF